jgi:hypothetical protein
MFCRHAESLLAMVATLQGQLTNLKQPIAEHRLRQEADKDWIPVLDGPFRATAYPSAARYDDSVPYWVRSELERDAALNANDTLAQRQQHQQQAAQTGIGMQPMLVQNIGRLSDGVEILVSPERYYGSFMSWLLPAWPYRAETLETQVHPLPPSNRDHLSVTGPYGEPFWRYDSAFGCPCILPGHAEHITGYLTLRVLMIFMHLFNVRL